MVKLIGKKLKEATMFIEILLLIVIGLLVILLFVSIRKRRVNPAEFESSVSNVMGKLGIDRKIGEISTIAQDVQQNYRSLDRMLRVPAERGSFGEIALEKILSDSLPSDMFGMRERIFNGKMPDAHIKSTAGIICIDSKFPLDNFRKMVEVEDTEKEDFKKQFIKDVQGHLEKILQDYVHPEAGSADFAFAFIPSESVYYFLTTEVYDMLLNYAKKGVHVVSPLTLAYKVELVRAGVHAKKLSEEAIRIKNDIIKISKAFEDVDKAWKIFYETHFRQAWNKAEDVNNAYKKLHEEFDRVARLSDVEEITPEEISEKKETP